MYMFIPGPAARSRGSANPVAPDAQHRARHRARTSIRTRIHVNGPTNRPATDQRWIGASVPERTRSMRLLRLMQLKWDHVWFDASSVRGGMTGNNTRACQGWRVASPAIARPAAQPLVTRHDRAPHPPAPLSSARSGCSARRSIPLFHLSKRASPRRATRPLDAPARRAR